MSISTNLASVQSNCPNNSKLDGVENKYVPSHPIRCPILLRTPTRTHLISRQSPNRDGRSPLQTFAPIPHPIVVNILHLSDIHLGSGLSHGCINPATGLNTRLEDFMATLEQCIDRALAEPVDLVLFGGDAFPDATPPPLHQDAFAQQFCRLATADIPAVLLVGNHDQYSQGQGGHSLSLYRTLSVPGFVVGDRLQTVTITTRGGPVQVTTLPWINRSALLTRPDMAHLSGADIRDRLLQKLDVALEAETRRLDSSIPSILLAHVMVDRARYGAERHLAVGKGFTVPLSLLARPAYDYVALGHVHRYQVLCDLPPTIYPGSIERVDFSEEKEAKGFVLADVRIDGTQYEFVPLDVRRFCTIRVDLAETSDDVPPMSRLEREIANRDVGEAIVRLFYRIRSDQSAEIDDRRLHEALASAHSYTISPEVVVAAPVRLPGLAAADLTPLDALTQYLQAREDLANLHADMLAAARQLVDCDEFDRRDSHLPSPPMDPHQDEPAAEQLDLGLESSSLQQT